MGCTESFSPQNIDKPHLIYPTPHAQLPSSMNQTISSSKTNKQKKSKQINQQVKVFREYDLKIMYDQSKGDLRIFFHGLSQKISQFYLKTNGYILEMMNEHRLDTTQSKILISQKIILMSLEILMFLGNQTNYVLDYDVFKQINSIQKNMINYLQMKYPRGGKAFVPGDLMKIFKNFNMVEHSSCDILRNMNIAFTNPQKTQIIKNIKTLFNTIFQQLDHKFPLFEGYLQEHIFKVASSDGQKKTLWHKIGRKIPQTVAKYKINDDDEDLTITSPQIFRVIIKWVSYLEEYSDNPQQFINKDSFKLLNFQDGKISFDDIDANQIEASLQILKNKLSNIQVQSKDYVNKLRNQMNIFNMNLLKILGNCEFKQKYIPDNDSLIIKYASYNTLLVSWILVQKLTFLIEKLITVSIQIQKQQKIRLDLIKFSLTDLMRSMVKGNKKQILAVFENIKKKQAEGELKIIKIKNRLGTPLNDAMIIFKMKQSFLICELQLILSGNDSKSEQLKNIQFLNHFLYELERTPYGVMSQSAVVLGFKDTRIEYENNIGFKQTQQFDISNCQKEHASEVSIQKIQKKPIICSYCTNFYFPFQNIFPYKSCSKCSIFKCCQCIFSDNRTLEQYQIHKKFSEKLASCLFSDKNKLKDINIQKFIKTYSLPQKFYLKDKLNMRSTPKQLSDYFKNNQLPEKIKQKRILSQLFYFLYIQFKGNHTKLSLMIWNPNRSKIEYSYFPTQNFHNQPRALTSRYDFIVFLQPSKIIQIQVDKAQKNNILYLATENIRQLRKNPKKYSGILMKDSKDQKQQSFIVLKIEDYIVTKFDGIEVDDYVLKSKNQFKYNSLSQTLDNLPDIEIVKENVMMKSLGITSNHLNFFQKCQWKSKVRILNISDNKITNLSVIFGHLSSLEFLFASKNFINKIQILKEHHHLRKLICSDNYVKHTNGLEKLKALNNLNLMRNRLQSIPKMKFEKLRQLYLSNNQIKSTNNLQNCQFPALQILFISSSFILDDNKQKMKIGFPNLKKILSQYNQFLQLQITSSNLQYLDCSHANLQNLIFKTKNIKELSIGSNNIKNISQLFQNQFPKLTKILANSCSYYQSFILPPLNCPKLVELDLSYSTVKNLPAVSKSYIQQLKILDMTSTQIKQMVQLDTPKLQKLKFGGQHLESIQNLSVCLFPKMLELKIIGNTSKQIEKFPTFFNQSIQKLELENLKFKSLDSFQTNKLFQLKIMQLQALYCDQFPVLNMPNLQKLFIYSCEFKTYKKLSNSKIIQLKQLVINTNDYMMDTSDLQVDINTLQTPKLEKIQILGAVRINYAQILKNLSEITSIKITYSSFKQFPVINLPKLHELYLNSCNIRDISKLALCEFPQIRIIDISYCSLLEDVPHLNFQNLQNLFMSGCKIRDLSEFSKSDLPKIEILNFSSNQIKKYPPLKFTNIKQFNIQYNQLEDLDGLQEFYCPKLQQFNLSSCLNLKKQILPVLNFPNLINICLTSCNLTDISNLQHSNLPSLEQLQLYQCKFNKLPILKLSRLRDVYINGNYDQYIQLNCSNLKFWQCPKLEKISLNYYKIKQLPNLKIQSLLTIQMYEVQFQEKFQLQLYCQELKHVYIQQSKNLTKFVPNAQLQNLTLNGSQIQHIQFDMIKSQRIVISYGNLKRVQNLILPKTLQLNLSQNKIENLQNFIKQGFSLQILNLASNMIVEFPKIQFPKLRQLDLSYNKIKQIDLRKEKLPVLNRLTLNNNVQSQQGSLIIQNMELINLEWLDISFNNIKSVDFFKKLDYNKNLQFIAANNNITNFEYLPPCSTLQLYDNKIKNLDWIQNIEKPKEQFIYLYLSNCSLKNIDGLKLGGNNFKYISICENQNQLIIDASKIQMNNLENLTMEGCKIKKFENLHSKNSQKLNSLYLSRNLLQQFGKGLVCSKLLTLYLSQNNISKMHAFQAPLLESLYLSKNNLQSLDFIRESRWPRITYLSLSYNKIRKLCNMDNFPQIYTLEIDNNPIEDIQEVITTKRANKIYMTYSLSLKSPQNTRKSAIQKLQKVFPDCNYFELEDIMQKNEANQQSLNQQNKDNGEINDVDQSDGQYVEIKRI